ncbi:major royal jelly protein [Phyllosticta citriasiana]|uniref:major royal jelly protein n=1 Tax=Phyllosticta citriasiana TaxID=595635 RepID=UPI0030FD8A54
MMRSALIGVFIIGLGFAQDLLTDPGVAGPPLELVHLYYDQFPTAAELLPNNTERPYPSLDLNNPPGGAINYSTTPPTGAALATHLIGVQSVVIDASDRLWILDTGRAIDPRSGTQVPATAPGGPKLIDVDLSTDTIFQTIVFPPSVAPPESYLNDVRVDVAAAVAYITDSGGDALVVVVDLATGGSARRLVGHPSTRAEPHGGELGFISVGADGIALSADGATLHFCALASRALYAVPQRGSEVRAQGGVVALGQKGFSDGMEADDRGLVYWGSMEQNAVGWFSIAADGHLYFTNDQLNLAPSFNSGNDDRKKPYSLFRVPLPDGGRKITRR